MTLTPRAAAPVMLASLLAGCVSVPRDSGFADVHHRIAEGTKQPVAWDPRRPVAPLDDAAATALLQDDLTADRAVQIAFAHNRDLQATLEGLGVARAELIAAS